MRALAVGSMVAVLAVGSGLAVADDLFQPGWRGDPGSTYQQWTFDGDDNPAAPEVSLNPYGTGTATMSSVWADIGPGRSGVWMDLDLIELWIPNQQEPNDYKELWVQITYLIDDFFVPPAYVAPTVDVPGAVYLGGETVILETGPVNHWELQLSQWRIEPNPPDETINITWLPPGRPYGAVDQIVVDTICIPEPGAVSLLVVGVLALLKRKRTS